MKYIQIAFTFLTLCVSLSNDGFGQVIDVTGFLYDSLSGLPIESGHIFIEDSAVGTISAKSGEFELKVPNGYRDAMVTISCMGYKRKVQPVNTFANNQRIILLVPGVTVLNEVNITSEIDSGYFILNKAIKAVENNYPRKRHQLEGFYRELSVRDTTYTRLIEASIIIEETGYQRTSFDRNDLDMTKSKIKIRELRKSDDNRTYDKIGALYNYVFGEKNDLYEILEDNYIRFLGTKSAHFLSTNFMKEYDIRLAGTTEHNGKNVYVIMLDLLTKTFFQRNVKFYINKEDFAFLKIENEMTLSVNDEKMQRMAIDGKYIYQSEVHYRKVKDRYVPFTIHCRKYASNTNPIVTTGENTHLQYIDLAFLLTSANEDNLDKIRSKEKSQQDADINNVDWPYNKAFWESYNILILNPPNPKAVTHLERIRSLEKQFENHD